MGGGWDVEEKGVLDLAQDSTELGESSLVLAKAVCAGTGVWGLWYRTLSNCRTSMAGVSESQKPWDH